MGNLDRKRKLENELNASSNLSEEQMQVVIYLSIGTYWKLGCCYFSIRVEQIVVLAKMSGTKCSMHGFTIVLESMVLKFS